MRIRSISVLALVCFMLSVGLGCAGQTREIPRYVRLTILHTNDLHGHLFPFEYGDEKDVGGVARRATLIERLRHEPAGVTLVLDAGDVFTRGPLASAYMGEPDIAAMNATQYDCMTLGNNEFKGAEGIAGQENMIRRIGQVTFPVVCANASYADSGKTIVPPYLILDRGAVRIGIFGVTAPRVAAYPQAVGLRIDDPIAVAKRIVPILKEQADIVVALTHVGYDLDKQLAAAVPDIDIIVGGDSHTWVYHPEVISASSSPRAFWVGGPVVAQDGEWGKCVGRIDAILRRQGSHDFQVMSVSGSLVPIDGRVAPDRGVERIIGRFSAPYEKIVGRWGKRVSKSDAPSVVAEAFRQGGGAQIGAAAPFAVEAALESGAVTSLDLLRLYPSERPIVVGKLTGKSLLTILGDQSFALSGVGRDASGAAMIDGHPIEPDALYTVCSDDNLFSGYPDAKPVGSGKNAQQALKEYVRAHGVTQ